MIKSPAIDMPMIGSHHIAGKGTVRRGLNPNMFSEYIMISWSPMAVDAPRSSKRLLNGLKVNTDW
jgi:hypothetical protein